jgi:hypothetical protein
MEATGVKQPLTTNVVGRQRRCRWWLPRQCRAMLEFASRFFGVRRNLRPPALWLYLTNDEGASARKQPSSGPQAGFLILG